MTAIAHIATILLLAVIFLHAPYRFSAVQIASLIAIFALADRGTAILWSPVIPKLGCKKSLLLGNLLCFGSVLGLTLFHYYFWCAIALFFTGLGLSLESLATRLWISNTEGNEKRISGFGQLHRTINAGYLLGSAGAFVVPAYQQNLFALANS